MKLPVLFVSLIAPSIAMASTPAGPPCVEIPPTAPPEVQQCLQNACKAYRVAVAACNGDSECITQAHTIYGMNVSSCWPVVLEAAPTTKEWATIWYADGTYGVAFDLWDVPEHAVTFEF